MARAGSRRARRRPGPCSDYALRHRPHGHRRAAPPTTTQTMKALRILADKSGLALPAGRVTLSTWASCRRWNAWPPTVMPDLAISLHATTEEPLDRGAGEPGVRARWISSRRARAFPSSGGSGSPLSTCCCERRQRHRRRRPAAGEAARRAPREGEPHSPERGGGHCLLPAIRPAGGPLRATPLGSSRHGVGPPLARAGHSGGVWAARSRSRHG